MRRIVVYAVIAIFVILSFCTVSLYHGSFSRFRDSQFFTNDRDQHVRPSPPITKTENWIVASPKAGSMAITMTDIIVYNRVPKTGSTSFTKAIICPLSEKNNFNVVYVLKKKYNFSITDQVGFARKVAQRHNKPVVYNGHFAFIDFTRFGLQNPIYIQIVREPIERMVSHYYFYRFGDTFRGYADLRGVSKRGDNKTFDECIKQSHIDCDLGRWLWLQIPFFCGHTAECWKPGSKWALEQAKFNLANHYALVGLANDVSNFALVLEAMFPVFFKGSSNLFSDGEPRVRETRHKLTPSNETIEIIKQTKIWKLENEFYLFAVNTWNFIKEKTVNTDKSNPSTKPPPLKYRGGSWCKETIKYKN